MEEEEEIQLDPDPEPNPELTPQTQDQLRERVLGQADSAAEDLEVGGSDEMIESPSMTYVSELFIAMEVVAYSWICMLVVLCSWDALSKGKISPIGATLAYSIGMCVSYLVLNATCVKLPTIECEAEAPETPEERARPSLPYLISHGVASLLACSTVFLQFYLMEVGNALVFQIAWTVLPTAYMATQSLWKVDFLYERKIGLVTDVVACGCFLAIVFGFHKSSLVPGILWFAAKSQAIMLDNKMRLVDGYKPSLSMLWNAGGTAFVSFMVMIQVEAARFDAGTALSTLIITSLGFAKGCLFLFFDSPRLERNEDSRRHAWKSNARMALTGTVFYFWWNQSGVSVAEFLVFATAFGASVGNRILRKRGESDPSE
jgi:hypothetical protein